MDRTIAGGKVARPKPGQVQGGTVQQDASLPTHTKDASRSIITARHTSVPQRSAVVIDLHVIEGGGRQTHSGGAWEGPAGHNALAGGSARRVFLRVVAHAAPLSITD